MSEISEEDLLRAAKILLGAPVRGPEPSARFVERGTELAIVTDATARRIGDALHAAATQLGASATMLILDRPQDKPLKVLPPAVRSILSSTQAAIFAAKAPNGERSLREQLAAVVQ